MSYRLQAADYRVEVFGSAAEFLSRRRSEAACCAVLDLQMPGPSGLELQEALARSEEPLPVIFLTAHGDVSSSVRAMKGGAVDFLTKPVFGDSVTPSFLRSEIYWLTGQMRQRKKYWRRIYSQPGRIFHRYSQSRQAAIPFCNS